MADNDSTSRDYSYNGDIGTPQATDIPGVNNIGDFTVGITPSTIQGVDPNTGMSFAVAGKGLNDINITPASAIAAGAGALGAAAFAGKGDLLSAGVTLATGLVGAVVEIATQAFASPPTGPDHGLIAAAWDATLNSATYGTPQPGAFGIDQGDKNIGGGGGYGFGGYDGGYNGYGGGDPTAELHG